MSTNKVYVGNINYEATSTDLVKLFSEHGVVTEAMVIPSAEPGKSKGFGFVTFESSDSAERAISELNGKEYLGRVLVVRKAEEK